MAFHLVSELKVSSAANFFLIKEQDSEKFICVTFISLKTMKTKSLFFWLMRGGERIQIPL